MPPEHAAGAVWRRWVGQRYQHLPHTKWSYPEIKLLSHLLSAGCIWPVEPSSPDCAAVSRPICWHFLLGPCKQSRPLAVPQVLIFSSSKRMLKILEQMVIISGYNYRCRSAACVPIPGIGAAALTCTGSAQPPSTPTGSAQPPSSLCSPPDEEDPLAGQLAATHSCKQ